MSFVELLSAPDCLNVDRARALLRTCLDRYGASIGVVEFAECE